MTAGLLLLFVAFQQPLTYKQELVAMEADYARIAADDKPYTRYLSLHAAPADIEAEQVLRFILPHLSTQQIVERCLPVELPGTRFHRINLRDLVWQHGWEAVIKSYPYAPSDSLIVRADWLIWITSDAELSSAYYDLLYGEKRFKSAGVREYGSAGVRKEFPTTGGPRRGDKPSALPPASGLQPPASFPATAEEFFSFWGVDSSRLKPFHRAVVIDQAKSGVALHTRMVLFVPNGLGVASQTFDSESGVGEGDALSKLDGGFKFDATEAIVAMPKVSLRTGESFAAQAYLLTDGRQKTVNEADARIVVDKTDKLPLIRTPGSCIRCHASGILSLPENAVNAMIADGVEVFAKSKEGQDAFERFYLLNLNRDVKRFQDDFSQFVQAACGEDVTPAEVVGDYGKLLTWYDAPVSLEQAAVEVHATDAAELKNAIGLFAERQGSATIRLATLAHGRSVPRGVFESEVYPQAVAALAAWRRK